MQTQLFDRRQLLSASAAGTAAVIWSGRLPAADDIESLSFIIVSDTHLGRKDTLSAEKQWRRAIEEINQLPGQFVLHLGDIVDSGREEQYPVYLETRAALKKPIHEIPGNHDPPDLFRKFVSDRTDRSVDYGGIRFLLFNNSHRDSHDGFIDPEQIEWLEQSCVDAAKSGLKIVIGCHVPIHTNRNPDRGWYVKPIHGQEAFYEVYQRHSEQILACLHGHFHNGIRGWRDHGKMVEVLCPSLAYNQNRNLKERIATGAATGFFVDELRPGYVLAEVENGRLTLRYKPLGEVPNGEYAADWN